MLVNLWVKDTQSGEIHQIGTDPHDSLELFEGNVHYVNMQSMSGTLGGDYTFVDAPDSDAYISVTPEELMLNRELVHKDLVERIKDRRKEYDKDRTNGRFIDITLKYHEVVSLVNKYGAEFTYIGFNKCLMKSDSFWFNSGMNVAAVYYKGYTLYFDVAGEVNGSLEVDNLDDNIEIIPCNSGGGFSPKYGIYAEYAPEVLKHIRNDYDIKKYKDDGSLVLESNNWLNAVIMHDESNSRYKDSSFPVGDNIIEALLTYVEDFFKYVDECIAQGVVWAEGAPNWMN